MGGRNSLTRVMLVTKRRWFGGQTAEYRACNAYEMLQIHKLFTHRRPNSTTLVAVVKDYRRAHPTAPPMC